MGRVVDHIKTFYWPRQGGKTVKLIRLSAEKKYPIIVKDQDTARDLKNRADKMGLDIPDPITIDYVLYNQDTNKKYAGYGKCLIDDADCILNIITIKKLGLELDTLALVSRNEKGEEIGYTWR